MSGALRGWGVMRVPNSVLQSDLPPNKSGKVGVGSSALWKEKHVPMGH
jgi:hypothetical protein